MIVLLISGGARVASQPVLEVVHELGPEGVQVHLALWGAPSSSLRDQAASAVVWGKEKVLVDPPADQNIMGPTDATDFTSTSDAEVQPAARPPRARSRRVQHFQLQAVRVGNRIRRIGQSGRTWRHLRRDSRVMALVAQTEVVVALDAQALLAAWQLAKRFPDPQIVYGLSAGRGVITRLLVDEPSHP